MTSNVASPKPTHRKNVSDWDFAAQSGTTSEMSLKTTDNILTQNVRFKDQQDEYTYVMKSAVDPTRSLMDTSDADLANFFSRPIKIAEEFWGTNNLIFFDINPWTEYCENPRVINRLSNFNLLRADMKIKILINGNGFLYGRCIAAYLPLLGYDTMSLSSALLPQTIVQDSQQPHVFLDPRNSTGGTIHVPFFFHKNYLSIPDSEWTDMGKLTVRSINNLKHANGASDQVTVSVFAWLENVQLTVLTSQEPSTLIPQSGREQVEANTKGMISGPASAVAKAAGALKVIPQLAPFATATELAANVTADVARSLGYCRPTVTRDHEPVKPATASSLALCTVPDTTQRVTVDDKNELTIDPAISGLGSADSLAVAEIAKRESYLTTFTWEMGTPAETLLWNARVDPCHWAEDGFTPNAFYFPACCVAALPFKFWNGTMNFRFQIVCSAFHKGRLKIVYDPNFLASNEYNVNYLRVIDIADETDFTVSVGNGQQVNLLSHHRPGFDSVTQMYSTTAYASKEEGNGVIGVYVVNELTTPNSTVNNDIQINVYISMSDDFEGFVPDNAFQYFKFGAQMGTELVPESETTTEPDAPVHSTTEMIAMGNTDSPLLNKVFTGESVKSFRTLLKRYNYHTATIYGLGATTYMTGARPYFPYLRGEVAGAVDNKAGGGTYNFCNTLLMHWILYGFSGWRGSIRWKLLYRSGFNTTNNMACTTIRVERYPARSNQYNNAILSPTYATESALRSNSVLTSPYNTAPSMLSATNGLVYQNSLVNPSVEFEIPFYTNVRFVPGKQENWTAAPVFNDGWIYQVVGRGLNDTIYDGYAAVGEDIQAYFWTGLPRMYFEENAPGAA